MIKFFDKFPFSKLKIEIRPCSFPDTGILIKVKARIQVSYTARILALQLHSVARE